MSQPPAVAMTGVFGHGQLRLYLLKLLDEAPRHGYEIIRLLEDRFYGLYAPSAGTIYPRLQRLEREGRVTAVKGEGGRKTYHITAAGRAELADRADEVAALETDIRASVQGLAEEIREEVRGSAQDVRAELRQAAEEIRRQQPTPGGDTTGRGGRRGRRAWRDLIGAGDELPDVGRIVQEVASWWQVEPPTRATPEPPSGADVGRPGTTEPPHEVEPPAPGTSDGPQRRRAQGARDRATGRGREIQAAVDVLLSTLDRHACRLSPAQLVAAQDVLVDCMRRLTVIVNGPDQPSAEPADDAPPPDTDSPG